MSCVGLRLYVNDCNDDVVLLRFDTHVGVEQPGSDGEVILQHLPLFTLFLGGEGITCQAIAQIQ